MGKKGRVFVRGLTSETYGLGQFRQAQLAAERVRDDSVVVDDAKVAHSGDSEKSRTWWRVGPGDEEFLTQTLQVHFVELPPHSSNRGHGHQNEASFYILEGAGYEIHDDQRYDWKAGELVFVHTDSVHRHYNPYDEKAVALVMKAKCTWMFLGLLQQGRSGPIERPDEFGEREDWSRIWTDGVLERKKVVRQEDTVWETTPMGRVRVLNSPERTDLRQFSVDVFELDIPAGSHSGKHWKMADEILYVLDGSGYSLHWEVQEEIAEKYYARVAKEATRHEIKKGDTLYVPQNTIAMHFAADGTPLRLLSAQNRMFKHLGYDKVHYFENAPEYTGELAEAATSV
ncbi:cupin domain-containing protein [Amycolatopsis sp. FDAARGOS 1241]|uniref:cupin domain-containing protein n=1 Tax=Amycolatopsis sp. FDAARGOS 1241 TaxID=2778070 RepID=UPI00195143FD|nr:cupin domain-containing protein [Amycolatopsis sp. FDAARGOS 1241]QRP50452.1 cupin domain-containing protein [Amycolatopsis sp. FDAARGOS 1241]